MYRVGQKSQETLLFQKEKRKSYLKVMGKGAHHLNNVKNMAAIF